MQQEEWWELGVQAHIRHHVNISLCKRLNQTQKAQGPSVKRPIRHRDQNSVNCMKKDSFVLKHVQAKTVKKINVLQRYFIAFSDDFCRVYFMSFGHIFALLVNKALIVQRVSPGDSWISLNTALKNPHVKLRVLLCMYLWAYRNMSHFWAWSVTGLGSLRQFEIDRHREEVKIHHHLCSSWRINLLDFVTSADSVFLTQDFTLEVWVEFKVSISYFLMNVCLLPPWVNASAGMPCTELIAGRSKWYLAGQITGVHDFPNFLGQSGWSKSLKPIFSSSFTVVCSGFVCAMCVQPSQNLAVEGNSLPSQVSA